MLPALLVGLALQASASCNVMKYGAKGDGVTEDTAAIQAAVAACGGGSGGNGGGTVVLPKGNTFLSYPFNVTGNNMVLRVEGRLIGPETPDLKRWTVLPHFPSYELSRTGHWTRYAPLVGAYNVTNLTITGAGTIDGNGAWWWANANTLSSERPRLVEPEWVKGLKVTDITLTQSMYVGRKSPLATKNLLEVTDGLRRAP